MSQTDNPNRHTPLEQQQEEQSRTEQSNSKIQDVWPIIRVHGDARQSQTFLETFSVKVKHLLQQQRKWGEIFPIIHCQHASSYMLVMFLCLSLATAIHLLLALLLIRLDLYIKNKIK